MTSVLAKSLLSILLGAWLNPVTLPALTLVSTRLAATGCQACVASNKRAEQSSFNTGRLCSWLQQLSLNGYGQSCGCQAKSSLTRSCRVYGESPSLHAIWQLTWHQSLQSVFKPCECAWYRNAQHATAHMQPICQREVDGSQIWKGLCGLI